MKTIAVINQKGGVGKTSVVVHLGWGASLLRKKKTVLVDFDGQSNLTATILGENFSDTPPGLTSKALFTKSPDGAPHPLTDTLSLISGTKGLHEVEGKGEDEVIHYPRMHLKALQDQFDIAVIDCPPTFGRRMSAALIAADYVVSPISLDDYSLQGLNELQRNIVAVQQRFNPRLKNLGLIINRINPRSKSHKDAIERLKASLPKFVLPQMLIERIAVSDAISEKRPVWENPRGASDRAAAKEWKAMVEGVIGRVE